MGQLKLPKPKVVIFDISGTVVKTSFIEKILLPYLQNTIREYLEEKWNEKETIDDVQRLRKQSAKDAEMGTEGPNIASKDTDEAEQKETVAQYVLWCMENKKSSRAYQLICFHIWFDGFNKGNIETPVYSDVAIQLKKWKFNDEINFYIYSNGWIEIQKMFMLKTNHGDLSSIISDYFDTDNGPLTDPESYKKILAKIGEEPENVLFLTKSGEEARAAASIGINVTLVLTHRKNIEKLEEEDKQFNKIRSFMELEFE